MRLRLADVLLALAGLAAYRVVTLLEPQRSAVFDAEHSAKLDNALVALEALR